VAVKYGANYLTWLNALTLQPSGSRSLYLGPFSMLARPPTGSGVAFAYQSGLVRFASPQRLAWTGSVRLRGMSEPIILWAAPRTLFAVDTLSVAAVDPVTHRLLWLKRLPRSLTPFDYEQEVATPAGVVFLLSPMDGSVGATTLVSVDLSGRIRQTLLAQIQSGATQDPSGASLFSGSQPGLTIDPGANIAYVVGGDGTVAAVDLATLAVTYHDQPRTLAVAEKIVSGPSRDATWLGNGLIAVTGVNGQAWLDSSKNYQEIVKPAGLSIINTNTWTTSQIDPDATGVVFANGLLLTTGVTWDTTTGSSGAHPVGDGLTAYTTGGAKAFHLLGQAPVQQVWVDNQLAYAWQVPSSETGPSTITVLDSTTGAALHTLKISKRQPPEPLSAIP
jgi:hypothetical protein